MADALNPRQFVSLDYNNADLYPGLNQRPPTATPLNLPLENLSAKPPSANQNAFDLAYNRSEEIRRQSLFKEQQAAGQAAQLALREREIARNQAAQASRPKPELEQPTVSNRDYESRYKIPVTQAGQPNTGAPPPTTKQTAARANSLVEPTAHSAPVALAEAVPVTAAGGVISRLPRALPQPAGRLAIPGVVAGVDFGARVISGQSVQHAVTSAVAGQVGFVAGFAIGSAIGGPILGYVGGAIGGMVASRIADSFFNEIPKPAVIPVDVPGASEFIGGQINGVFYRVVAIKPASQGDPEVRVFNNLRGRIDGFREVIVNETSYQTYLVSNNGETVADLGVSQSRWTQLHITRMDGEPDVMPSPVIPAPPPDNRPGFFESPLNAANAIPLGTPQQGQPKYQRRDVAPSLPSNNLPNSNSPYFPGHGGLAPSYTPNPTQTPSNLGSLLPAVVPIQQPLPFAEPDDMPTPRSFQVSGPGSQGAPISSNGNFPVATFPDSPLFPTPNVRYDDQGNVLPTDIDGNKPFEFTPTPLDLNPIRPNALPVGNPLTSKAEPVPDAQSPTPKANNAPKAETPAETVARKQTETNDAIQKKIQDDIARLGGLATAIAALTPAIQGIPDAIAKSPTVQDANKTTIQGAVCEIAQPTGCLGAPIKKAEDAANNNGNKLDELNAALGAGNAGANAAQLALLNVIDAKLGAQLPGGIGGKLTRFAQWAHLDRVMNIMSLGASIHNAAMLSNNLSQTLFSVIGNMLSIIGLKDAEGQAFDIGSVISKSIEGLIKGAIGEENYKVLDANWKRANRIYQATANLLNSIQSLSASILSALEVVGQWNAKVANALKRFGVVGEKAYSWMNPNVNFQNKYFTALESATNVISQVDQVASEVLSIKETVGQIVEQKKGLDDSLKETDASKQKAELPEAVKLAQKESESKAASAAFPLAENDKEVDEDI